MNRFRTKFSAQLAVVLVLLFALVAVACGTDDGGGEGVTMGGTEDYPKRIRMIESETVFTEADMKAAGWKSQKDFLIEYPSATTFKWGFMNQTEVGVLIYASAADATTLGVTAAEEQTFRREPDGQAPDGNFVDRISCRDKAGASAVKANTGFTSKSFSASYLEPSNSDDDNTDILPRGCSNRFPTYNDYTVIGNVVLMCEGDDGRLLEPSTNCAKIAEWLTN